MSKFNSTNTMKTTNKNGHVAYKYNDKELLVSMVLTTFFQEDKYYGDNSSDLVKLAEKMAKTDPEFVSNLARYARKVMHLRSVSHVLTAIVAHEINSKPYIAATCRDVIERADDITEILACYISKYGKPIPNGLKKALGDGMISKYKTLAKYNSPGKSVSFKDVLRICHPKAPNDEVNTVFKQVLDDNLPTFVRWETELSANGNNAETWEKLIAEKKVGYMAMLRNLRNIINADPSNVDDVYDTIGDKNAVLRSKQLPFRFLSAYKNLPAGAPKKARNVLETACRESAANLPRLKGRTAIMIDASGSMDGTLSGKSTVQYGEIAVLIGLIANYICDDSVVLAFNNTTKELPVNDYSSILEYSTTRRFAGGTDMSSPFEYMCDKNIKADRIIILSDNEVNQQMFSSYWGRPIQKCLEEYRKKVGKTVWLHGIDLAGYGTTQFMGEKVNHIAGWSERVLEYISLVENGLDGQVKIIEKGDF